MDIQELICCSVSTELAPFACVCQERIAKAHGSQCGFCTPGIVMSMYALLRNKPMPRMSDVEEAFHGSDWHAYSSVEHHSHSKRCNLTCSVIVLFRQSVSLHRL